MAKDWHLTLQFSDSPVPELVQTQFICPLLEEEIVGLRAQYPGRGAVSIRWQKATIALCILALRIKLHRLNESLSGPVIFGSRGSIANVLANLLYIPTSSCDMLGFTSTGMSILRRMILVSNGRLESPAIPIQVFVRDGVFRAHNSIAIVRGDRAIDHPTELASLLTDLESQVLPKGTISPHAAIQMAA